MSGLPQGWAETTLGEVCSKPQYGWTSKAGKTGRLRYLRTTDISGGEIDWDSVPYCVDEPDSAEKYRLEKNDIVVSRAGSVGVSYRLGTVPCDVVFASYLIRFRALEEVIDPRLIEFFLRSENYWRAISELSAGIAIPNVNASKLAELELPLPPLNEQRRIVAKLETLLGKVDACQQRLAKIPGILKRFRQSILAAACSGRLTADWREVQGVCEGEELPEGWQFRSVGDVGKVCNGSTPSRKVHQFWNGDIPWLSSGEVRNNVISETRETISKEGYDNSSVRLLPAGTVLLAMIGEGKTRGQTAILQIDATINQNIAAVVIDQNMIASKYLWYWFQCQYESTRQSGSGSGPQALNCQRVRELPLNLPPLPEQHEIVRHVEALFTLADQLEARYAKAKAHVDKLTQSIFAKAFRGELVPQDENDEPASVLLERIRAAKAPSPLPLSRRARGARPNPRPLGEGGAQRRVREILLAAEPSAAYDTGGQAAFSARNQPVPDRILSAMEPGRDYSRAELTAASGITDAQWTWAIRQLKEECKVTQAGERRGARYRLN